MFSFREIVLVGLVLITTGGGDAAARAQGERTVPPALFSDLKWHCVGPFDGGPVASVAGVSGQAGVYVITTPNGDAWQTTDGGDSWQPVGRQKIVGASTADPHRWTDPANPQRIARTDPQGISVSLDEGKTWTASRHLPIADVAHLAPHERAVESYPRTIAGAIATVSIADPSRAGLVFAGTDVGVEVSFDSGAHWQSLHLNMPAVRINDLDIRGNDLVAATAGRSTWTLDDISPLRQLTAPSASIDATEAILYKPADIVLSDAESATGDGLSGADLDYYLAAATNGEVTLDVRDASGRVVHRDQSASSDASDPWLAVTRPLSAAAGHHRVLWNLRFDAPPAPNHRFAHFARALFEELPPDPNGPRVLAGTYRVRLTAGTTIREQPIVIRDDPNATPARLTAERDAFDLAMKADAAMDVAHRSFLQLSRARAALHPLLASADADLAATAADLDTRLNQIDGSDWTGLVIPDADEEEAGEVDEKEGKHPDFVPPKAVSLSKDYDDPTSILGRGFGNVDHPPAFAILATTLGSVITKAGVAAQAQAALDVDTYDLACQQLADVLETWRTINASDVPRLNEVLAARGSPALPVVTDVPAMSCAAK